MARACTHPRHCAPSPAELSGSISRFDFSHDTVTALLPYTVHPVRFIPPSKSLSFVWHDAPQTHPHSPCAACCRTQDSLPHSLCATFGTLNMSTHPCPTTLPPALQSISPPIVIVQFRPMPVHPSSSLPPTSLTLTGA